MTTATINLIDWTVAFAQLPAFEALPPAYRMALARFRTPDEPQPEPELVHDLLERRLIVDEDGILIVAKSLSAIQAVAALGLRSTRNLDNRHPGAAHYMQHVWGRKPTLAAEAFLRITGNFLSQERLLDICQAEGMTIPLMTARHWSCPTTFEETAHPIHYDQYPALYRQGQALLRWIAGHTVAPTLAEALATLKKSAISALVVSWTTRYLTLFLGFDTATAQITLGLHPMVYALRNRPPATPPTDCGDLPTTTTTFRVDDAVMVLAAAAVTPLKIRQDHVLAVRESERLLARLDPLPASVPAIATQPNRIERSLMLLQVMGVLSQPYYDSELRPTPTGATFLALTAAERHHQVLTYLRPTLHDDDDGDQSELGYRQLLGWCAGTTRLSSALGEGPTLRLAGECLRQLDAATWRLDHALDWWSRQTHSTAPRTPNLSLEKYRRNDLELVIVQWLYPLGIIAIGGSADQRVIRLTDAGRWMVGLTKTWTQPVVQRHARPLIVQADHTLILLAPDTQLEVELARFAERYPGVSGTGCLFRLSKAAALDAALAGITGPAALAVLTEACAKPVPTNVERELLAWFAAARVALVSTETLITAPDEATAIRIATLAGPPARCLTPTIVALGPPRSLAALNRKLRKHGINLRQNSVDE